MIESRGFDPMTINLSMGAETECRSAAAPQGLCESWRIAELEKGMKNLLLPSLPAENKQTEVDLPARAENGENKQVDQFLVEALQNPRDRLTILRMELDVRKFIQNPTQQQLEFQQFPTSYLRLAAHRVAQHYGLQSMVLDWNSSDASGTRIIARKTPESRCPAICLADIPVNLPEEEKTNVRFAIKPRPQNGFRANGHQRGLNLSPAKSVEERKEEYNRARARIFNRSSNSELGEISVEAELDAEHCCSNGALKPEEKPSMDGFSEKHAKGSLDCSSGTDRVHNRKGETEPIGGVKTNNSRIAIFRDREKDRNDPDYDRSYDRYAQCFDTGFGFNLGPFNMQPFYSPLVHYNVEFPQLGLLHRAHAYIEPANQTAPSHLCGPWVLPPSTVGYGPPNAVMGTLSPAYMSGQSASAMYLQSSQFTLPNPPMVYAQPHERFQQSLVQTQIHHQPELSFSEGRRC